MKTRSFIRALIAATVVLLLAACATGPKFQSAEQPPANMGDIYLYRTAAIYAFGTSFDTLVDGKKVGELPNASYLVMRLTPGKHILQVAPGALGQKSEIQLDVQKGTTGFYQYDFNSGPLANYFFLGSAIQVRSSERALREMKELSLGRGA
jgi:hypothetical protein